MIANLALLALIYGVEGTTQGPNSTKTHIRSTIQQADIEAHLFFEKIRVKIENLNKNHKSRIQGILLSRKEPRYTPNIDEFLGNQINSKLENNGIRK